MWTATAIMLVIYIGLTVLEKEGDEWSVFFKGLRLLMIATLCVMVILTLLYSGLGEMTSCGVGLLTGLVLYLIERFVDKNKKN